jgi:hypothetical protein
MYVWLFLYHFLPCNVGVVNLVVQYKSERGFRGPQNCLATVGELLVPYRIAAGRPQLGHQLSPNGPYIRAPFTNLVTVSLSGLIALCYCRWVVGALPGTSSRLVSCPADSMHLFPFLFCYTIYINLLHVSVSVAAPNQTLLSFSICKSQAAQMHDDDYSEQLLGCTLALMNTALAICTSIHSKRGKARLGAMPYRHLPSAKSRPTFNF